MEIALKRLSHLVIHVLRQSHRNEVWENQLSGYLFFLFLALPSKFVHTFFIFIPDLHKTVILQIRIYLTIFIVLTSHFHRACNWELYSCNIEKIGLLVLFYLSNRSKEKAIWWELELVNGCGWATMPGELPLGLFGVPFVYKELDSVVCSRVPRRLVWTYPNLDCVPSRQKFRTFSEKNVFFLENANGILL